MEFIEYIGRLGYSAAIAHMNTIAKDRRPDPCEDHSRCATAGRCVGTCEKS